jgi:ubiquitin-like modifier-activating enzyme ATG7
MSGLAEVQRKADEAEADVDWDEEDEGGLEDEGEII